MKHILTVLIFTLMLGLSAPACNCTTTITGKDASAGGSVMASHTDDGLAVAGRGLRGRARVVSKARGQEVSLHLASGSISSCMVLNRFSREAGHG